MVLVSIFIACNEQNLEDNTNKPGSDSEPAPAESMPDTGDSPPVVEECNGVDDDGDGEVDEGFADANQNGQADCLDQECPEAQVGSEHSVEPVAECTPVLGGPADPWNVRVQWSWAGLAQDPLFNAVYSAPVVGNLTDDDGDGVAGPEDNPEIVVVASKNPWHVSENVNWLVVLDGATGQEEWHSENAMMQANSPVLADVDLDGWTDIVALKEDYTVVVFDGDGGKKWESDVVMDWMMHPLMTVADVDGDGWPEIIANDLVLNGEDGTLQFVFPADQVPTYLMSVNPLPLDVDGDGQDEILRAGDTYRLDGTLLWSFPDGDEHLRCFWTAAIQADTDPFPEVLGLGQSLYVADEDGTLLVEASIPYISAGPPCIGDFDNDGASEIVWPDFLSLSMYELDGTFIWSVPIDDTSSVAACSGFDFDGDGGLEVVYSDEEYFYIFDGKTGATRFQDDSHYSGTAVEYPVVADVDHDGAAEIVVTGDSAHGGPPITLYEHNGPGWPGAGPTWATHDFAMTNVEPDGHVPAAPAPYWSQYGVFRARVGEDSWFQQPDLVASITGACVMDCTFGPVEVTLQVGNQGHTDVWEGTLLTLYADQGDHLDWITTVSLPTLPAGTWLSGWTLALSPEQVGTNGFQAVIDDDGTGVGTVTECNETNNTAAFHDAACP